MGDDPLTDPRHGQVRNTLRIVGPLTMALGAIFMAVGLINFFSSMGTFEPPRYFWCLFVGMPLFAVGGLFTKLAFLGAIARYLAGEAAPVSQDTFNYVAHGTAPGVRDIARAVREGLGGGHGEIACPKCQGLNPVSTHYCGHCGTPLAGIATPDEL